MRKMFVVLLLSLLIGGLTGPTWAVVSLDVTEIGILEYKDYWDGTAITNPYGIEVWVNGSNITSVSVTDPHSGNHSLTDWGGGQWGFDDGGFASLVALEASYGNGNYAFNFNSGEDTVTIDYQNTEPSGFANITNPTDGQTGVGLNPTYTWDSAAGYGEALGMWVIEDPSGVADDIYENVPEYNTALTSWQPGSLSELTEYEFELSVFKAQGGSVQALSTDGSDDFDYYGLFDYTNIVGFTTIPEPATALSLLGMMGLYFVYRRR